MHTIINFKEVQQKIGENIEHVRLLRKKTVKEIASLLNLSDTAYRNIERGLTDISVSKLFHLASILKVKHTDLVVFDIETFLSNDANEKVSSHYKKQLDENYSLRIQQYKEENLFLKKQIEILENMLTNHEVNLEKTRSYRTG